LKGCGNNYDGFPLRNINDNKYEIRGCMFENQMHRELYYTKKIQHILKKENILCTNIPIGWYEYSSNEIYPNIKRTCGIFKTLSDKRLGDHILIGLERVMSLIVKKSNIEFSTKRESIETWMNIFGDENIHLLIDTNKFKIEESILSLEIPNKFNFDKFNKELWEKNCLELKIFYEKYPETSLLSYIYYCFGYEVGNILGILHENNILWVF
jgi:hypothetical protein